MPDGSRIETGRPPVKLGILISGSGTNLQAIIDAIARGDLRADICAVISNRAKARGLERARNAGIATHVIDNRKFASREDFDRAILAVLQPLSVELVICAGFMRLLSAVILEAFPNRVLNTHNALLPSFPGIHGPREALEYGVKIAGCTVFFVTEGTDTGPVIIQAAVPVMPGDGEEALAERIKAVEHRILPQAVRLYQEGRLEVSGRKVVIQGAQQESADATLIVPPIR
ncbi:MAG: phosphoribosylglycinamide formyltransferase [Candidatus Binataceae bacterium]